jgi:hypothetical protein
VAFCQASPRRTMSTNTLRMVGPRYGGATPGASGFAVEFTMRDACPGMEDCPA